MSSGWSWNGGRHVAKSLWNKIPLGRMAKEEWVQVQSYLSHIAVWTVKFWCLIFVGVSWCIGLICAASVTYVVFYHFMIPQNHTSIPVHFDFSSSPSAFIQPHATVYLHGEKQWRYSDRMTNDDLREEHTKSRYFQPGHSYNAYLDLSFPDSQQNMECGMISVEMMALSSGQLLATSLQSFLPQYTSPLVRWMWSWSFALPLVTGLIQEKQQLTLLMFDQLLEQEIAPISEFKIHLKSPNANKFQLYSATLRLQVQLFGLRYFMYHWPLSTGLVITAMIFSVQLFWSAVLLLILCLMCCSGGNGGKGEHEQDADDVFAAQAVREQQRAHERERGREVEESNEGDPAEIDLFILGESAGASQDFWRDTDDSPSPTMEDAVDDSSTRSSYSSASSSIEGQQQPPSSKKFVAPGHRMRDVRPTTTPTAHAPRRHPSHHFASQVPSRHPLSSSLTSSSSFTPVEGRTARTHASSGRSSSNRPIQPAPSSAPSDFERTPVAPSSQIQDDADLLRDVDASVNDRDLLDGEEEPQQDDEVQTLPVEAEEDEQVNPNRNNPDVIASTILRHRTQR